MRSLWLEKETGEKVRKGCEAGSAQKVSGFPVSFLPDSACIPIFVLYFPWDAYSSADAGRILQVILSLQCLSFCFHTALSLGDISQSGKSKFSWLQRLAWALLTPSNPPKQEMEAKPQNYTWTVYWSYCPSTEMTLSGCVRCWGCYNTWSNGLA